MSTGSAQVHIAEMMKGGDGAAEYIQQVAGDMNKQVAGSDGSLQYTRVPVSGGGLEQMAVPALLVLANNAVPKLVKRGGSTMKISGGKGRRRRGGKPVLDDQGNPVLDVQGNPVDDGQPVVESAIGDSVVGGNMLQQAIVPATLVLASNMFGKRKMSLTPKYTKRRSNRRRLNRRKRVSRRFRRGTR